MNMEIPTIVSDTLIAIILILAVFAVGAGAMWLIDRLLDGPRRS